MARQANADGVRQKIFQFLEEYMEANGGRPPTIQEICDGVHIPSKSHVLYHLKSLEKKGILERAKHEARGIKALKNQTGEPLIWARQTHLPIRGAIAAGQPLPNVDEPFQETMAVEMVNPPKDAFMLRVEGDSMIEDGILDGDYLIVQPTQPRLENGTTIVAVHTGVSDSQFGSATVKRFYREQGRVRLQPANQTMQPIYINAEAWEKEWMVRMKVIGLYRKYF